MGADIVQNVALPECKSDRQRQFLDALMRGVLPTDAAKEAGYEHYSVVAYDASQIVGWREVCERARKSYLSNIYELAVKNLTDLMLHAERETVRLDATKTVIQLQGVNLGDKDDAPKDMEQLARQVLKTIDTLPEKAVPIQAETSGAIDAAMPTNMPSKHGRRAKRK